MIRLSQFLLCGHVQVKRRTNLSGGVSHLVRHSASFPLDKQPKTVSSARKNGEFQTLFGSLLQLSIRSELKTVCLRASSADASDATYSRKCSRGVYETRDVAGARGRATLEKGRNKIGGFAPRAVACFGEMRLAKAPIGVFRDVEEGEEQTKPSLDSDSEREKRILINGRETQLVEEERLFAARVTELGYLKRRSFADASS